MDMEKLKAIAETLGRKSILNGLKKQSKKLRRQGKNENIWDLRD